jgi:hypothetical protein
MKRILLEVLGDFSFFKVGHPAQKNFSARSCLTLSGA